MGTKVATFSFDAIMTTKGSTKQTIDISFVKSPLVSDVRVDSSSAVIFGTPGNRLLYTISPSDYKGSLVFTSSNNDVATVDSAGNINWKKTGYATFTVAIPSSDQYLPSSSTSAVAVYASSQTSLFENGIENWQKGQPAHADVVKDDFTPDKDCRNTLLVTETNLFIGIPYGHFASNFIANYNTCYNLTDFKINIGGADGAFESVTLSKYWGWWQKDCMGKYTMSAWIAFTVNDKLTGKSASYTSPTSARFGGSWSYPFETTIPFH